MIRLHPLSRPLLLAILVASFAFAALASGTTSVVAGKPLPSIDGHALAQPFGDCSFVQVEIDWSGVKGPGYAELELNGANPTTMVYKSNAGGVSGLVPTSAGTTEITSITVTAYKKSGRMLVTDTIQITPLAC